MSSTPTGALRNKVRSALNTVLVDGKVVREMNSEFTGFDLKRTMPEGHWSTAVNVHLDRVKQLTSGKEIDDASDKDLERVLEYIKDEKRKLVNGVEAISKLKKIALRRNRDVDKELKTIREDIEACKFLMGAAGGEYALIRASGISLQNGVIAARLRFLRDRYGKETQRFVDGLIQRIRAANVRKDRLLRSGIKEKNVQWAIYHGQRAAELATVRFAGEDVREARQKMARLTFRDFVETFRENSAAVTEQGEDN